MKLEFSSFADAGDHDKERIVIKALSDLDIGEYAVFLSALSDTRSPTAGRKTAYWFPDGMVKPGDLIVLYSKSGSSSKKDIGEGRTAHFYYWGLDKAVWGNDDKTAVILRIAEWTHRNPKMMQ